MPKVVPRFRFLLTFFKYAVSLSPKKGLCFWKKEVDLVHDILDYGRCFYFQWTPKLKVLSHEHATNKSSREFPLLPLFNLRCEICYQMQLLRWRAQWKKDGRMSSECDEEYKGLTKSITPVYQFPFWKFLVKYSWDSGHKFKLQPMEYTLIHVFNVAIFLDKEAFQSYGQIN